MTNTKIRIGTIIAILMVLMGVTPIVAEEQMSSAGEAAPGFQTGALEDIAGGAVFNSLRITGSALKPRENNVSYAFGSGGGCTYATSGDALTVWNHSVTLPQGAVVDTLRMYYNDTSASSSFGWFTVHDLYGSLVQEWLVSSSGDFGNGFNDSAMIDHQIDYNLYSYVLNWRPSVTGSSMQLCGFRIFYR